MEDAHLALDDEAMKRLCPALPADFRVAIFGIFDGHGGRNVADLAKDRLPLHVLTRLMETPSFQRARPEAGSCDADPVEVQRALELAWADTDRETQDAARAQGWSDGCCAVVKQAGKRGRYR